MPPQQRRQSANEAGSNNQPEAGGHDVQPEVAEPQIAASTTRAFRRTSNTAAGALAKKQDPISARAVHIHVGAGDSSTGWSDLVVVAADRPPDEADARKQRWTKSKALLKRTLRRVAIVLAAAGIVAASVLLPISQSLKADAPQQLVEVLTPAPSLRLLAAWSNPASAPPGGVASLLPPELRASVLRERPAHGMGGVLILDLASEAALDQAQAALSNATGLRYALRDFPLAQDYRIDGPLVGPEELFARVWGNEPDSFMRRRRRRLAMVGGEGAVAGAGTAGVEGEEARRPGAAGDALGAAAARRLRRLAGGRGAARGLAAAAGAPANASAPAAGTAGANASSSSAAAAALAELLRGLPAHLLPGPSGLDAPAAWALSEGSPSVVVAVLGSGVEGSHPRLGGAIWSNPREVPGDGVDDDGNGLADDVEGWDFGGRCLGAGPRPAPATPGAPPCACAPGPDTSDADGRGTHAAALAAGEASAVSLTAGVAPGTRVMPLRIADCHSGRLWASAAAEALGYALENGAQIILAPWADGAERGTNSSGGEALGSGSAGGEGVGGGAAGGDTARRRLFEDLVSPLRRAGVLLVTADVRPPPAGHAAAARAAGAAGAIAAGGAAEPGAPAPAEGLPCSLAGEFDNVVCVAPGDVEGPWPAVGAPGGPAAPPVALLAPSRGLPSAYAGAAHAAASGASPAAAVGAGAAALVWSALGRRLGGDFAALAPAVKRILEGDNGGGGGSLSDAARIVASAPQNVSKAWLSAFGNGGGGGAAAAVPNPRVVRIGPDGGNAAAAGEAGADAPAPAPAPRRAGARPLKLAAAVAEARGGELGEVPVFPRGASYVPPPRAAPPLASSKSAMSGARPTVAVPGVALSWYVNQYGATNAAVLQGVLHRPAAAFEILEWEYGAKGDTVLTASLSAALPVREAGGGYEIRAEAGDPFVLWLGGRRLMLAEDASKAPPGGWTARVAFRGQGNYTLTAMVFRKPDAPDGTRFRVTWRPPGAADFSPLPGLFTLGRRPEEAGADLELLVRSAAAAARAGGVAQIEDGPLPPPPGAGGNATLAAAASAAAGAAGANGAGGAAPRPARRRLLQGGWSWDLSGSRQRRYRHQPPHPARPPLPRAPHQLPRQQPQRPPQPRPPHPPPQQQHLPQQQHPPHQVTQLKPREAKGGAAAKGAAAGAAAGTHAGAGKAGHGGAERLKVVSLPASPVPAPPRARALSSPPRPAWLPALPGSAGLAASLTARPQSAQTVLLPSLALGAPLQRGGGLQTLEFDGAPYRLQRAMVGGSAGSAPLEALGSVQGWADGAELLRGGRGGVRFELACERCWLLLDGALVAGSKDGPARSGCVELPAAAAAAAAAGFGGGGGDVSKAAALVHLEVQFAAKSLPVAGLWLRRRGCKPDSVIAAEAAAAAERAAEAAMAAASARGRGQGPALQEAPEPAEDDYNEDASPFAPLGAALAPGWVLSSKDLLAGGYQEGMVCEVSTAGAPASADVAAKGGPPARAFALVPRAAPPGGGGLEAASAPRFSSAKHSADASFGEAALNRSAAASAAAPPDPAEGQEYEQEEEEAREREERRQQALLQQQAAAAARQQQQQAAAAARRAPGAAAGALAPLAPLAPFQQPPGAMPPNPLAALIPGLLPQQQAQPAGPAAGGSGGGGGNDGVDPFSPLTSWLNGLLSSWWGGRQLRSVGEGGAGAQGAARRLQGAQAPAAKKPGQGQPKQQPKQHKQAPPDEPAGRLLSFTAARLAPALVAAAPEGARFDVACWGYWNGTLGANASIGADPSASLAGAATIRAGGARLAALPASPSAVAAMGVESVAAAWDEHRARLADAAFSVPAGGVEWGSPSRRGYAVSGSAFDGGDGSLLRLLVLRWRGVDGNAALWVADERGPWRLEPRALWVPPTAAAAAVAV